MVRGRVGVVGEREEESGDLAGRGERGFGGKRRAEIWRENAGRYPALRSLLGPAPHRAVLGTCRARVTFAARREVTAHLPFCSIFFFWGGGGKIMILPGSPPPTVGELRGCVRLQEVGGSPCGCTPPIPISRPTGTSVPEQREQRGEGRRGLNVNKANKQAQLFKSIKNFK